MPVYLTVRNSLACACHLWLAESVLEYCKHRTHACIPGSPRSRLSCALPPTFLPERPSWQVDPRDPARPFRFSVQVGADNTYAGVDVALPARLGGRGVYDQQGSVIMPAGSMGESSLLCCSVSAAQAARMLGGS